MMPGEAWSFPSHSHLNFICQSCQLEAMIPEVTWKALNFSTKEWNLLHAFPSPSLLKTENCCIQIFMSYFCGILSFYYSLPSVPQDTKYIKTWPKIISIFRDVFFSYSSGGKELLLWTTHSVMKISI